MVRSRSACVISPLSAALGKPARFEFLAELRRRLARADEDQHRVEILDLEDARQRLELVEAAHLDEPLVDGRDRGRLRS